MGSIGSRRGRCYCPELVYGEECSTGGYLTGEHRYTIHVTRVTFDCACGARMGRFASSGPDGVDPFGSCPAADRPWNRYEKA